MLPSRRPQPAIEIRTVAIRSTGGIRNSNRTKLAVAPTDCAMHHTEAIVKKWMTNDSPPTVPACLPGSADAPRQRVKPRPDAGWAPIVRNSGQRGLADRDERGSSRYGSRPNQQR